MEKSKILLIDDEPEFTSYLRQVLESRGPYTVREENDERKAVHAAIDFKPHLIVLDMVFPWVSGDIIASRIRQIEDLSLIPILFVTALVAEDQEGEKEHGKMTILSKPVKTEEFLGWVRVHLKEI